MKRFLAYTVITFLFLNSNLFAQPCTADGISIDAALLDPNSANNNFDTDMDGNAEVIDEFVQICNLSSATIDLSTYTYGDGDSGTTDIPLSGMIAPGECFVLMRGYTGTPPANFLINPSFPKLTNGGEPLTIKNTDTDNACVVAFGVNCSPSNNPNGYPCVEWPEDTDGIVTVGPVGTADPSITPADLGQSPLPVELIDLHAKVFDHGILISWSTLTEINNSHFVIERTSGSRSFEPIGEVSGKGTSTEKTDYSFWDENPLPGVNFYRLRQVDMDGKESLSNVVSARNQISATKVWPTGVSATLYINLDQQSIVNIFDSQMRLKWRGRLDKGVSTLNVAGYSPGMYFVEIINRTEKQTVKIIKN